MRDVTGLGLGRCFWRCRGAAGLGCCYVRGQGPKGEFMGWRLEGRDLAAHEMFVCEIGVYSGGGAPLCDDVVVMCVVDDSEASGV